MEPIGYTLQNADDLGQQIRNRRKSLGLSQQDIADSIGVARRVVGELERGKGTVRLEIAIASARAVGLDVVVRER